MTEEEFKTLKKGDKVMRRGKVYTVGGKYCRSDMSDTLCIGTAHYIPTLENNDGYHRDNFQLIAPDYDVYITNSRNNINFHPTLEEAKKRCETAKHSSAIYKKIVEYNVTELS